VSGPLWVKEMDLADCCSWHRSGVVCGKRGTNGEVVPVETLKADTFHDIKFECCTIWSDCLQFHGKCAKENHADR
jgi:hypothetical protein